MIIVYFEYRETHHSEEVARFIDEETYNLCWSTLYQQAKEANMIVTDSLVEGDEDQYPLTWEEKENLKEDL